MFPPERIVCLTEETVETLYLLGEERRIVGISGYVVRPPRARREKPRVSAFTTADVPKILNLKPDLVLTFSDLQADIAATLIRHGIEVHGFNQRTISEILDMVMALGALTGATDRAWRLAQELATSVAGVREQAARLPCQPKVYFGARQSRWWDRRFCRSEFQQASQGSRCNGGGGNPSRAGHHRWFVVRQEIPSGESCAAARFRLSGVDTCDSATFIFFSRLSAALRASAMLEPRRLSFTGLCRMKVNR
jgi:hypothetical protein